MASRKRARESSFLRVFDETRRLLNTATTVTLQPVRVTNPAYKASSKPGMFVEYLLDVPRGDYDLAIAARDYTPHRSRISVGAERTQTITVTLNRKGTPEEGNAVERAHAWFSDIRTFPAKRVAPDARRKAIDKKLRTFPPPGPPPPRNRAKWTVLGPRNISGRVRGLVAHPTDGETDFPGQPNAG